MNAREAMHLIELRSGREAIPATARSRTRCTPRSRRSTRRSPRRWTTSTARPSRGWSGSSARCGRTTAGPRCRAERCFLCRANVNCGGWAASPRRVRPRRPRDCKFATAVVDRASTRLEKAWASRRERPGARPAARPGRECPEGSEPAGRPEALGQGSAEGSALRRRGRHLGGPVAGGAEGSEVGGRVGRGSEPLLELAQRRPRRQRAARAPQSGLELRDRAVSRGQAREPAPAAPPGDEPQHQHDRARPEQRPRPPGDGAALLAAARPRWSAEGRGADRAGGRPAAPVRAGAPGRRPVVVARTRDRRLRRLDRCDLGTGRRRARRRVERHPAELVEPRLHPRVGVGVAHDPGVAPLREAAGLKPVATRAGTPPIRSSSAIAPEKCWQ